MFSFPIMRGTACSTLERICLKTLLISELVKYLSGWLNKKQTNWYTNKTFRFEMAQERSLSQKMTCFYERSVVDRMTSAHHPAEPRCGKACHMPMTRPPTQWTIALQQTGLLKCSLCVLRIQSFLALVYFQALTKLTSAKPSSDLITTYYTAFHPSFTNEIFYTLFTELLLLRTLFFMFDRWRRNGAKFPVIMLELVIAAVTLVVVYGIV